MFYGAVVVPIGTRVLESETEQGFITQQVTDWLNGCGAMALGIWLWILLDSRRTASRFRAKLWLWIGLTVLLIVLGVLHRRMDGLLDAKGHSVIDPATFYKHHRLYLITSTGQWFGSIALLAMTIRGWSISDRRQLGTHGLS